MMGVPYEVFLSGWLGFNLLFGALSAFLANRWGRDPFGWLLVGSVLGPIAFVLLLVTRRQDRRGARPSLVVPARTNGGRPTVLLAVDGSAVSDLAAKYIVEEVVVSPGDVCVVAVLPIERADALNEAESSPRGKLLAEEIEQHTGTACSTLRAAGIEYERMIRFGDPATEILSLAEETGCRLIVMGRRGRGKAAQFLLGSVSEKVVREASCAVMVVS